MIAMESTNPFVWLVVTFSLLASAFFSGIEIAFISSNKLKIEVDKSKGKLPGMILSPLIKTPDRVISSLLIGNNIALVVYSLAMVKLLEPAILTLMPAREVPPLYTLVVQTILSTLIILLFAEFLPKTFFRINPNAVLSFFALPVSLSYILLYPINYVFTSLSDFLLRKCFRIEMGRRELSFGPPDLDNYLREFAATTKKENEVEQEIQIFQNALEFRNVKVRECMIPRLEIVAVDESDPLPIVRDAFGDSGHSKILIYKDTVDNITGYIHSNDFFGNPATLKEIERPISIVPETMRAKDALAGLIKEHKGIALVVDEFGGTSGVVTIEDIIEEIFGEIRDEHDMEDLMEKQVGKGEFIFSGRLEVDYINDKYHLNLPESEEYETLSGLIIHIHESIPRQDDEIILGRFTFTILQAGETKIEKVHVRINA
jgi:CBS domain containing-hemolysin-like protein